MTKSKKPSYYNELFNVIKTQKNYTFSGIIIMIIYHTIQHLFYIKKGNGRMRRNLDIKINYSDLILRTVLIYHL